MLVDRLEGKWGRHTKDRQKCTHAESYEGIHCSVCKRKSTLSHLTFLLVTATQRRCFSLFIVACLHCLAFLFSIVFHQQSHSFFDCRIISHWRIDVNLLLQSNNMSHWNVMYFSTHTTYCFVTLFFCHCELITRLLDYFSSGRCHFLIEHNKTTACECVCVNSSHFVHHRY